MPAAFVGGALATGTGRASGSTSPAPSGARQKAFVGGDPRAEKVQHVIDEANHLKEMYEDTRRVRKERKASYEEAIRLNKDEREILRLKAEYLAAEHAEKYYEEDMTEKFEEAVHLTVKLYKIDVSAVKAIHYKGEGDYYAFMDGNRVLDIRYDAFRSGFVFESSLYLLLIRAPQVASVFIDDCSAIVLATPRYCEDDA